MKRLNIDWGDLSEAFEISHPEANYYLDIETGQLLLVTEEANRKVEQLHEEHFDPNAADAFDLEAILDATGMNDWQKQEVLTADFVEEHYGDRVIAIPKTSSHEAYEDMQDFISTIRDDRLYNLLQEATRGRGAFSRFRDIMRQNPAEQQRWYAFEEERTRHRILRWLEENGLELPDASPAMGDQ
ncbi:MAG: hypothetical protein JSW55_01650 [Chloroflexota bacterium]|nr:MAG: hypothetical protein JSW55_01650 [Chloroflexota bacterium]